MLLVNYYVNYVIIKLLFNGIKKMSKLKRQKKERKIGNL